MIVSQSFVGFKFDNDTKEIETFPLESGSRALHQMKVFKGMPNDIKIQVNEMSENLVQANGKKDSEFQIYFSGESFIADTPYVNQTQT